MMVDFTEELQQNTIMTLSDEELKDIPVDVQVKLLRDQVNVLYDSLYRCAEIFNSFQNITHNVTQCLDERINVVDCELFNHTNKCHAMLIIGNKEGSKNESNIP